MNRDLTARFSLQQVMLWGQYGFLFSYANPYMTEQLGLSDSTAGIVLGIATALAFLLQPLLTSFADRTSLDARRVALVASLVGALSASFAVLLPSAATALFAMACVTLQVLPSFSNAMGMQAVRTGCRINLAFARGLGSVSFGVTAKLTAVLIAKFGNQAIALSGAAGAALFFLTVLLFPSVHAGSAQEEKPDTIRRFFAQSPRFLPVLIATFLLYIGHNALCNCMFRIAQSKLPGAPADAATQLQGTALLLAALLELPAMFFFTKLLKKLRCDIWLGISCAFMTMRLLLTLLLPGEWGMITAQTMQAGGYAVFAVASVYYVGTVIPKRNVVKGQTYLGAANTLGCLLTYVLCGYLLDFMGVQVMLITCLLTSIGGTILMLLSTERVEHTIGT